MEREESLFLTISENHLRREYPEFIRIMSDPFREAGGWIAVYEGAILGGADRIIGLEDLNLRIRKHKYAAYNMGLLIPLVHLCLEVMVREQLKEERPGLQKMAKLAAGELMAQDPLNYRHFSGNWMLIYWMAQEFPETVTTECEKILRRLDAFHPDVRKHFLELVRGSAACRDEIELLEQAVRLYKEVFTRYFAMNRRDDILPEQAIVEDVDFTAQAAAMEHSVPADYDSSVADLNYEDRGDSGEDGLLLSEEELAVVPEYIAKNFGESFKKAKEMTELENALCVGIHEKRKVLFTDGLPEEVYEEDSGRGRALKASKDANRKMVEAHKDAVRQGIRSIEQAFRNAMNLRRDPERISSDHGTLINQRLWKADRVENPQLFDQVLQQDDPSVVVELLIDASGSQSVRQPMVAMQSYMFSTALSHMKIPHRVMSYCTYGDHTVLRRFRDYEDAMSRNQKILEYQATSNNRDGLALAAAGCDLRRRKEENRILIVFSDGLPNDMVSGRVRAGAPKKYIGEDAVQDTCDQVRRLRREGILVIGIFLGSDAELANERLIYGSNFIRIRRPEDFSSVAGRQLSQVLMQL